MHASRLCPCFDAQIPSLTLSMTAYVRPYAAGCGGLWGGADREFHRGRCIAGAAVGSIAGALVWRAQLKAEFDSLRTLHHSWRSSIPVAVTTTQNTTLDSGNIARIHDWAMSFTEAVGLRPKAPCRGRTSAKQNSFALQS